ncbi:MAG: peroxidase [Xanthobacteraceae bacterium]
MRRAPVLSEQLYDIQGMLNSGYGWLTDSRFWLLTIRDGQRDQARRWISQFVSRDLITTAKRVNSRKDTSIREAMAIAFSFSGLVKLGLTETAEHLFPTPFRSGMGSDLRQELLRDNPRERWRWSDVEDSTDRQTVHILIAQWQLPGEESKMPPPDPDTFTIRTVENRPNSFRDGKLYEPFGFRDGIAQPVIRGLREDGADSKRVQQDAGVYFEDRLVEPGEFVLGYRNGYDELNYCPDVAHWIQSGRATHPGGRFTLNGTYLAVRQIQQDVKAFESFEAAISRPGGSTICEKMMGRSKNGLPLLWKGGQNAKVSDSTADAFRYRVEDANGFACPIGAHIRRVNPRDSIGIDVQSSIKSTKLHRLLRRGRPYLELAEDDDNREGLFFIACNADLERQFEFLYQLWLRNFRFDDLHHEDDPIVGSPVQPKMFATPGLPSGGEVSLKAFTLTLGGGYFFLPGIKALQFIGEYS